MTNKKEELYEKAFLKLKELTGIQPARIVCDFEIALKNSLLTELQASLTGCLFHFARIIWRRIQGLGLTSRFKEDITFKKYTLEIIKGLLSIKEI